MKAQSPDGDRTIYLMDKVALEVQLNVDAFVNCFYQQADGSILKIYPNRYSTGYWVYAGQKILLPDAQYFHIVADAMDKVEGFMCLASSEDVLAKLPKPYQLDTFETLPANDFDALFSLCRRSTHTNLVGRAVTYRIQ